MSSSLPANGVAGAPVLRADPVLRAVALEKTYAPLVAGGVGLRLFHDLSL